MTFRRRILEPLGRRAARGRLGPASGSAGPDAVRDRPPGAGRPARFAGRRGTGLRVSLTGALAAAALALTALFALAPAPANPARGPSVALEDLAPSAAHRQSARAVVQLMNRHHYRKIRLDDAFGSRVLDRYLEFFDHDRKFFLAADIAEFDRFRSRIDDALLRGRLEYAFDVFKRYRARAAEGMATAAALVDRAFDFSRDETIMTDRSNASWARTRSQLEELWRRRVKNDLLKLELAGHEPEAAREALRERYAATDRRVHQINADDVVQYFLNAYTQSIDPHSTYLSPRSSEDFQIRMSLSLEGIGAALQTTGEHTIVRRIVPGGPADRSGKLHVNDRIIGVQQAGDHRMTDVVSWRLIDVVNLIRGPKGSEVRLLLLPASAASGVQRTISLIRDRIDLEDQSASRRLVEIDEGDGATTRIGVVEIPSFYLDIAGREAGRKDYRSTSRDVRRLVGELGSEGIDGLVVDLRGNQGGSLGEALRLAGLFIETGPIVQVRNASGSIRVRRDDDPSVAWEGPLAVLVDRRSASSSEIFSGAIQDYGRGLVIGGTTYGKGTVQQLVNLAPYGGAGRLKLTIAQYFRVSGEGVQQRGVRPDIALPTLYRTDTLGEETLDGALPWEQLDTSARRAARFQRSALASAVARSRDRRRVSERFRLLREEIEYRQGLDEPDALSLNRAERRRAHARAEADRQDRLEALATTSAGEDPESSPGRTFEDLQHELLLNEAAHVVADVVSAGERRLHGLAITD